MEKLLLNKEHIQQLAEKNKKLDGLTLAMIEGAAEIFLGYNRLVKSMSFYDELERPICRVKDLIGKRSPSILSTSPEGLDKQMDFVLKVTPLEDAVRGFLKKRQT